MTPVDIITETLQILGNPAWTGCGVIISTITAVIALSKTHQPQNTPRAIASKKKSAILLI